MPNVFVHHRVARALELAPALVAIVGLLAIPLPVRAFDIIGQEKLLRSSGDGGHSYKLTSLAQSFTYLR